MNSNISISIFIPGQKKSYFYNILGLQGLKQEVRDESCDANVNLRTC